MSDLSSEGGKPSKKSITVVEIAAKYGCTSTYETLEGYENLDDNQLLDIVRKYSGELAKD
jgi:hypothetical protein